jgi:hypothetical protein
MDKMTVNSAVVSILSTSLFSETACGMGLERSWFFWQLFCTEEEHDHCASVVWLLPLPIATKQV